MSGICRDGHKQEPMSNVCQIPLLSLRFMSVDFQLGEKNAINLFIGTTLLVEVSEKLAAEISIPIHLLLYSQFYPVIEFCCVCSFPMFSSYYRGHLNVKRLDGIKQ